MQIYLETYKTSSHFLQWLLGLIPWGTDRRKKPTILMSVSPHPYTQHNQEQSKVRGQMRATQLSETLQVTKINWYACGKLGWMKNEKDAPTALAPVTEERKTYLTICVKTVHNISTKAGKNSVTSLENQRVGHLGVFTGFTETHNFQFVVYIAK